MSLTEIVRNLPPKALYVVPAVSDVGFVARTVIDMKRHDVVVVTPMFLDPEALAMLPERRPVVVASDAKLEPEQQKALEWYRGS